MSSRQRIYLLAGVLGIALVVVVLAITLGGGSKNSQNRSVATPPSTFLKGVPQSGNALGRAGAPTLYVFEDPQCPYCRDWSVATMPDVVDTFVKTGKVRLVWQGIPIVGDNSIKGLQAAYAAGNQNKLWNFIDQLYKRQGAENTGWITDSVLRDAASSAGVNADQMLKDAGNMQGKVTEAENRATQYRLQGTPTFVLVKSPSPPQTLALTSLDSAAFNAALSTALGS